MKRPSPETGPGTLLRSGRRSLGLLTANRKTRKFLERLKPKQDALKKAQLRTNDVDDEVIDAAAAVEMVHLEGKELVTDLELVILGDVRKKREDAREKAVFPVSLTRLKQKSADDFHSAMVVLGAHLKSVPADSAIKRFQKPVEENLAEWKQPRLDLEAVRVKEATATATAAAALLAAKEAWLDACVSLHGALKEAFPRQRHFVEAFFPQLKCTCSPYPVVTTH